MRISLNWLKEYLNPPDLPVLEQELIHRLTMIGLPVESTEKQGDDVILDLEITTNRPDCLNHLGVAREVAAQLELSVQPPESSHVVGLEMGKVEVSIENPEECPRYAARLVKDVTVAESPRWLRQRLEAVGQRPINNLVDVTNYVLLELGHPLHAFDYHKLQGGCIVVRLAREGETLQTLDGIKRALDASMLAICDASRPVALAGIMGGTESEISTATRTVLLESAYFKPFSIRATAKKLGMRTEASYRFERGADPEIPVKALNRACRLIEQLNAGKTAGPLIDLYPGRVERQPIRLRRQRIKQVIGVSFEPAFVEGLLTLLGFEIVSSQPEEWVVQPPTFRADIEIEDDLVEEIVRHYGYERIPSTYPSPGLPEKALNYPRQESVLIEGLTASGFSEAVNYIFSTPVQEAEFWGESRPMIPIANPLTEEDSHLRTTLMAGLLTSLRRNFNYGNHEVRLFEIGKVFIPGTSGRLEDFRESNRLGLVASGVSYAAYWSAARDELNFLNIKGMLESFFSELGIEADFRPATGFGFLHPGVSAELSINEQPVGWAGELHPRLKDSFKFVQRVFLAELNLDPVYALPFPEPFYEPLSRFPAVERDISFLIDKTKEYGKLKRAIKSVNCPDLKDIQLIDLYQGSRLPEGKVSLTIRLAFQNPERTLTQQEVNQYCESVLALLRSRFAAEGRS